MPVALSIGFNVLLPRICLGFNSLLSYSSSPFSSAAVYENQVPFNISEENHDTFKLKTKASLVFKESAIMFESKTNLLCDFIVLIKAPIQVRLNRVTKRDLIDESIVKSRILNQWSDEKKEVLSDKIIENIDWKQTILLVEKLLVELKIQFNITD